MRPHRSLTHPPQRGLPWQRSIEGKPEGGDAPHPEQEHQRGQNSDRNQIGCPGAPPEANGGYDQDGPQGAAEFAAQHPDAHTAAQVRAREHPGHRRSNRVKGGRGESRDQQERDQGPIVRRDTEQAHGNARYRGSQNHEEPQIRAVRPMPDNRLKHRRRLSRQHQQAGLGFRQGKRLNEDGKQRRQESAVRVVYGLPAGQHDHVGGLEPLLLTPIGHRMLTREKAARTDRFSSLFNSQNGNSHGWTCPLKQARQAG